MGNNLAFQSSILALIKEITFVSQVCISAINDIHELYKSYTTNTDSLPRGENCLVYLIAFMF